MIQNKHQYEITKGQATKFEQAISNFKPADGVHALLNKAALESLKSQLEDLQAEMADYESRQEQQ